MPIWGLDIAAAIDCETSVDMRALWTKRQDASSGGRQALEYKQEDQDVGSQAAQALHGVRCMFKLRPLAVGTGRGHTDDKA